MLSQLLVPGSNQQWDWQCLPARCVHTNQIYAHTDKHTWLHISRTYTPNTHMNSNSTNSHVLLPFLAQQDGGVENTYRYSVDPSTSWPWILVSPVAGTQAHQPLRLQACSCCWYRPSYYPTGLLLAGQDSLHPPISKFLSWNSLGMGLDRVSFLLRTLGSHMPLCLCTPLGLCRWAWD